MNIKITGTGSYIPKVITANADFDNHEFYNLDGTGFPQDNKTTIAKFKTSDKLLANINKTIKRNCNLFLNDKNFHIS